MPYQPLRFPLPPRADQLVPGTVRAGESLLTRLSREVAVSSLASLTLSSPENIKQCLTQLGVLRMLSIRRGADAEEVRSRMRPPFGAS